MKMLTQTDVEKLRDDIQNTLVPSSISRRVELLKQKKITSQEFDEIANKEQELLNKADQLTHQLSVQIITDIEEPRKQIQATIGKLENAIKRIQEVNQFFANLAVALDILATLASAVVSPLPVAIHGIINKVTD